MDQIAQAIVQFIDEKTFLSLYKSGIQKHSKFKYTFCNLDRFCIWRSLCFLQSSIIAISDRMDYIHNDIIKENIMNKFPGHYGKLFHAFVNGMLKEFDEEMQCCNNNDIDYKELYIMTWNARQGCCSFCYRYHANFRFQCTHVVSICYVCERQKFINMTNCMKEFGINPKKHLYENLNGLLVMQFRRRTSIFREKISIRKADVKRMGLLKYGSILYWKKCVQRKKKKKKEE